MKKLDTRGLSALLLGVSLLGVVGCQQDNEAEVKAAANAAPKTAPAAPGPTTQSGMYEQQQKQGTTGKPEGYPGPR